MKGSTEEALNKALARIEALEQAVDTIVPLIKDMSEVLKIYDERLKKLEGPEPISLSKLLDDLLQR